MLVFKGRQSVARETVEMVSSAALSSPVKVEDMEGQKSEITGDEDFDKSYRIAVNSIMVFTDSLNRNTSLQGEDLEAAVEKRVKVRY